MGQHLFIVGFERCGIQTVVKALKASCRAAGFFAYEDVPTLCPEALALVSNEHWQTQDWLIRLDKYKWLGDRMPVVCDGNNRLGYFVRELAVLKNAKFILLLRPLLETLVSRVASLAHWPSILDRYPDFFRTAVLGLSGKRQAYNLYRVRPPDMNAPLHELYAQEWIINYRETMAQLAEVNQVFFMETAKIQESMPKLLQFVGPQLFNSEVARNEAAIKHNSILAEERGLDLLDFARDSILTKAAEVFTLVRNSLPSDPILERVLKI